MFHITLYSILHVVSLSHPILPVFVSLPSSAVSCIPLPPPTAPSQCLYCKQSFLPPFILVKSFQIYYVLTELSVGPWLECCPGFVVALRLHQPPPKIDISIYCLVEKVHMAFVVSKTPNTFLCFCNNCGWLSLPSADMFNPSVSYTALMTPASGWWVCLRGWGSFAVSGAWVILDERMVKTWHNLSAQKTPHNTVWYVFQLWRNLQIPKTNSPSERQRWIPDDPCRK